MTVQNAVPSAFTNLTTTTQWEDMFLAMGIPDVINDVPGGPFLAPTLNSGARTAVMAAGQALIRGQLWGCDAPVATAIPAASGNDRVDVLVLRLARAAGTAAAVVSPLVLTGTPAAANPAPPALASSATGNYDIPVSQWLSKADGTLISLEDRRHFTGSPVQVCTSATRPNAPARPMLAIETDTGSVVLWNGTTWTAVIAPWNSVSKTTVADVGPIGNEQTIHQITVTTDGSTDIEVDCNWPAIYKTGDTGAGNSQQLVMKILIDGNLVCHWYLHIGNNVSNSVYLDGGSVTYKTSADAGTTPSAGNHVVLFDALQGIGSANLFIKADATSPITLRVSPVYA